MNNPRNKEETTYVDIVAWDKLGETCNTYLKKGSSTLVEGRLVIRSYDDKDGNKRKATEVVIDNMQMLTSRGAGGESGGDYAGGGSNFAGARAGGGAPATNDTFGDEMEDEIPF